MPLDLGNSLNWDLVIRQTYRVRVTKINEDGSYEYISIPDISLIVDSPIIQIGVKSTHAEQVRREEGRLWWLGARASMRLLTLPSSTSDFPAAVKSKDQEEKCELGALTLIQFPNLGLFPYLLLIKIPHYIEDIYLEVWKYTGEIPSSDSSTELQSIAQTIEFIAKRDVPTDYRIE
jgi:hypothetical protein